MLQLDAWKRLPLDIFVFDSHVHNLLLKLKKPSFPSHVRIQFEESIGLPDLLKTIMESNDDDDAKCVEFDGDCVICGKDVEIQVYHYFVYSSNSQI